MLNCLQRTHAKAFTSPLSTLNINQAARLLNQNCKAYYSFILEIEDRMYIINSHFLSCCAS